jgi:predicted amidohydrolase
MPPTEQAPRARLRVTLLQLAVEDAAPERNLTRAEALLRGAPPADLFLLPELWTTGYAHAAWPAAARASTPRVLEALTALARELGGAIGGSLVAPGAGERLVNRFYLIRPDGTSETYDKTHLFAPMGEDRHLARGTRRAIAGAGPFRAGLSLCYDLRFPEMYRLDALDGADLFLVASAWPASRVETMRLLARARAVENQAFLVLCNRAGTGADGTVFGGHSAVIGPDGDAIHEAGADEATVSALLDRDRVTTARATLLVFAQRRGGVDWRA